MPSLDTPAWEIIVYSHKSMISQQIQNIRKISSLFDIRRWRAVFFWSSSSFLVWNMLLFLYESSLILTCKSCENTRSPYGEKQRTEENEGMRNESTCSHINPQQGCDLFGIEFIKRNEVCSRPVVTVVQEWVEEKRSAINTGKKRKERVKQWYRNQNKSPFNRVLYIPTTDSNHSQARSISSCGNNMKSIAVRNRSESAIVADVDDSVIQCRCTLFIWSKQASLVAWPQVQIVPSRHRMWAICSCTNRVRLMKRADFDSSEEEDKGKWEQNESRQKRKDGQDLI